MLYPTWNLRHVPFFSEEILTDDLKDYNFPSIKEFQHPNIYSAELRGLISNYINACPCIVATSVKRHNPYKDKFEMNLAYYSDGEIIFNNFLHDYILHDDFAIPELWLKIIESKKFKLGPLAFDANLLSSPDIGVFNTSQETFDQSPSIKKAIIDPYELI